jgi:nucleoid DNA-binding protein
LDIAYFIKELILLNECVILRGIGGFETTYKNAVLDKSKKHISPPGKKIYFRPDLVQDNGVLENHIARSLGIERSEASEAIDSFVQDFHDTIRQDSKVFMIGIGEFTLGKDKTVMFQEIRDENYLADSFGLDVLDIEVESSIKDNIKKPAYQPLKTEKRKFTGWYIAIGILLVLIIATSLIMISSSPGVSIFKRQVERLEVDESDVVVFAPEDKIEEDSTIRAIGHSIDESTEPKTALSIESTTTEKMKLTDQTYYLIAGSFKYSKNAERLKDNLSQKGFNPIVMEMGSYTRVIIGTYNDKQLALAELRRIRNQFDQSVWILEKQN